MSINLSALQKQRRDTAANWTAENPTLLAGEIGLESDTGYWKVGDGATAWTSLAYVTGLGAEIPVSRLADGTARQLLQTAANGTDVEWTSNVDVPGTLDVTGTGTFDGNVTIAGDLTVNGTTTTINTQDLLVEDKNVIIGNVTSPTDVTADGGGITLKGTTDKTINWVDATDAWTLSEHVSIASGKEYRIDGTKVLDATSLGSGVLITSANITDGTIVNGDINASAAIAGTKISPDFGSQNVTTTGNSTAASFIPTSSTAPTNGVYLPAANSVAISTNGTGRLFVGSDGKVTVNHQSFASPIDSPLAVAFGAGASIGCFRFSDNTSGPSLRLSKSRSGTVGTNALVSNGDTLGNIEFYGADGSTYYVGASIRSSADTPSLGAMPGTLIFSTTPSASTSPTERLRITSAGLVGIGSSVPQAELNVAKTGGAATVYIESDAGNNATTSILRFGGASGRSASIQGFRGASSNIHSLDFYTYNSGDVFGMRLTPTGLGIGTTSPTATLHVVGTGAAFGKSGDASNPRIILEPVSGGPQKISGYGDGDSTEQQLAFHTGLFGTEACRIDSSGRFLVGTSSTSGVALLQVQGYVGDTNGLGLLALRVGSSSPANGASLGRIDFNDSTDSRGASIDVQRDGGTWGASSKPSRLVFSTCPDGSASPVERWRIDSSGSLVGVAGSAFVAPYVYNTTTATAANVNVDATGFLRRSTSSIKYKINVETIQDQYADAILGCRPVWYQSTCEADKPEWGYWGFIAEEVAAIDPRLCFFKEEEDGTLEPEGVQYDRFVPHLLNLIQRQQQAIKTLEAKVAALESA